MSKEEYRNAGKENEEKKRGQKEEQNDQESIRETKRGRTREQ